MFGSTCDCAVGGKEEASTVNLSPYNWASVCRRAVKQPAHKEPSKAKGSLTCKLQAKTIVVNYTRLHIKVIKAVLCLISYLFMRDSSMSSLVGDSSAGQ